MKQLRDFVLVIGAALVSVGAGMIYTPAGLIAAGVLLMLGAVAAGDTA